MNADATAGRYEFGIRVDDPARALADLASTVALVDDIVAQFDRLDRWPIDEDFIDSWGALRRELLNLRHRLEAIHVRLTT